MASSAPVTVLCMASYEKGHDLLRACKAEGARVLFVTVEKLRDAAWPHDAIDEIYYLPDEASQDDLIHSVSYLARSEDIARIIPLDEFDLENAAALREHLRLPGLGLTAMRYFRDKLAMRMQARAAGIRVPDFVPVINYDEIRAFMDRCPLPWILKPRSEASAIGLKKIKDPEVLWRTLDELGDRQSHFLLEEFVAGDVYHVDGLVSNGEVLFSEAHRYAATPFEVMHSGGLFATCTLARNDDEAATCRAHTAQLMEALGLKHGAFHTEFIRDTDGRFHFLETAARVGGAHIAEMLEAATGLNLWREWGRLEVTDARGSTYTLPTPRTDYAGVLISLARQEHPDLSGYREEEIVWRMQKTHHAGLIVRADTPVRVEELLHSYMPRFYADFHTSMPAPDKATD
ncbi:MAG: ATP-grasp domain-containing protein [Bacteroidetes bacterium]|nr:ATP-grasp domain-containing protein [Bacteroidota bacterium]